MISKIIHYEQYSSLHDIAPDYYSDAITGYFAREGKKIEISDSHLKGTLGVTLGGSLDGKPVFIKSHRPSAFHQYNLDKEFLFLHSIYGNSLFLRKIRLSIPGSQFSAIVMEELRGNVVFGSLEQDITTIETCLAGLEGASSGLEPHRKSIVQADYCFSFLFEKASFALKFLDSRGYIDKKLKHRLEHTFVNHGYEALSEQYFCHGDLSSKNIMLLGTKPILVDWEDAMLGSKIFDICYWLTFMDQRKHYNSGYFREFAAKNGDVLFYMSVILLLKGYLSVLDGSVFHNSLSIQERIEELYDLI